MAGSLGLVLVAGLEDLRLCHLLVLAPAALCLDSTIVDWSWWRLARSPAACIAPPVMWELVKNQHSSNVELTCAASASINIFEQLLCVIILVGSSTCCGGLEF